MPVQRGTVTIVNEVLRGRKGRVESVEDEGCDERKSRFRREKDGNPSDGGTTGCRED